jgi:gamma-glutamyltranspeptidase/glutathione hydrolase
MEEGLTMFREQRMNTVFIGVVLLLGFLVSVSTPSWATVNTRPNLMGTHGAVACGHYLAAEAGMQMLRAGGNAIDAGVAQVLAQSVLEYGMFGLGGEVPMIIYSAKDQKVYTISGNTVAPKAATIDWFEKNDILLIPADGFLAAGVSAVCDAVVTALDKFGTMSFSEVVEPAITLARDGFPVFYAMQGRIQSAEKSFHEWWPSSAELLLPGGKVPEIGQIFKNPDYANTLQRLVDAEKAALAKGATRSEALKAVRDYFYKGPIAQEIVKFQKEFKCPDSTGKAWYGLLEVEDFENYHAKVEEPVSTTFRGYEVYKCGPWTQGPVFLQHLNLLEGYDLKAMGPLSAEYIHIWTETAKLAHADKIKYYGDPDFVYVPIKGLLSKEYAAERRKLVDPNKANNDDRPGDPYPYDKVAMRPPDLDLSPEPLLADHTATTGTRAVDAQGNMFSATPSGGWFTSSPTIPGLGFCLNTRPQMFYLERGHAKSLEPGKRPSTSLTPSLVLKDGKPFMVFGTPGGDQQDQWTLQTFLNIVEFGMDIQEAIDSPKWHTRSMRTLFYPLDRAPGVLVIENRVPEDVRNKLAEMGHKISVATKAGWLGPIGLDAWANDYSTVITIDVNTGLIKAGASTRWDTNYAIVW